MKKTYQNPTTMVVKIQAVQMIASSEKMGFGNSVNTASGAESRRGGSSWDDEDDYDE